MCTQFDLISTITQPQFNMAVTSDQPNLILSIGNDRWNNSFIALILTTLSSTYDKHWFSCSSSEAVSSLFTCSSSEDPYH